MPFEFPVGYVDALRRRESGRAEGNYTIKARTSTASGAYQFVKKTWIGLGGAWGGDDSKAFGGLNPSRETQDAMFKKFTAQNASVLAGANIPLTSQNLYAAHFLGAGTARKILRMPDSARADIAAGSSATNANPFLRGLTVAGFKANIAKTFAGGSGEANFHPTAKV